jgi:hypothetical protein
MPSATGLVHKASLESRGWTVSVSGPRILVRGNSVTIANNDDSPTSGDNTDFGTSNIGEETIHTFSIVNEGTHEMHLAGTPRIAIGGANPNDFVVTANPAATIYPWGGNSTFDIAFSPKSPGVRQAIVTIVNDGIDGSQPFQFLIQGTGNPQISDTTLATGTISCFGSETILTIAGDDTEVIIENGASVNLIAAESVILLPGFHAIAGSNVHAWITTDGTFCDELPSPASNYKSEELVVLVRDIDKSCYEQWVKVFPNPNKGVFTLQVENMAFPVEAVVVNSSGATVFKTNIAGDTNTPFNLSQLAKGFYFVIVNNGQAKLTKKMVVE